MPPPRRSSCSAAATSRSRRAWPSTCARRSRPAASRAARWTASLGCSTPCARPAASGASRTRRRTIRETSGRGEGGARLARLARPRPSRARTLTRPRLRPSGARGGGAPPPPATTADKARWRPRTATVTNGRAACWASCKRQPPSTGARSLRMRRRSAAPGRGRQRRRRWPSLQARSGSLAAGPEGRVAARRGESWRRQR
mmetsp:Transcript_36803/g.121375  ORF Transcript_36803/g.121375 Transcript_36803/m.121375 type:complete len:200 (-) Transcript_36803:108-707(-)